jgi:hypothetical protein
VATTSNTRYCANGNQCVLYEPVDGKPVKLNSLNTDEICGACRERERDAQLESAQRGPHAASPTPRRREGRTRSRTGSEGKEAAILSSSATAEIYDLKADLTISLYARRGPFWEMVKDVRERWGIEPKVVVPSPTMGGTSDPETFLREPSPFEPEDMPDPYEEKKEWDRFLLEWWIDLRRLQAQEIPEKYRDTGLESDWQRFFAVCVLYDPPDTELSAFAEVVGPEPEAVLDPRAPDDLPNEDIRMLKPPVKSLQELTQYEDWRWDCILYSWGEVLRESFLDPGELLIDIERRCPGFINRYHRKVERDSSRFYIEVDERTTKDDVVKAHRMVRALQEGRTPRGAPERDRLIAVQCAILKDQHKWEYRAIAERFGLGSKDTAKAHVKLGRQILEQD